MCVYLCVCGKNAYALSFQQIASVPCGTLAARPRCWALAPQNVVPQPPSAGPPGPASPRFPLPQPREPPSTLCLAFFLVFRFRTEVRSCRICLSPPAPFTQRTVLQVPPCCCKQQNRLLSCGMMFCRADVLSRWSLVKMLRLCRCTFLACWRGTSFLSETSASFTWNQTRRLSSVHGPRLLPGV